MNGRIILVTAAALLFAGQVTHVAGRQAGAPDVLMPSPDVELRIKVSANVVFRDGRRPAAPSGTFPLEAGESPSYQFSVGEIAPEGCSVGMSMSIAQTLTPPDPLPPVWWVVTTDFVSKHFDGATVDVRWQRRVNTPLLHEPAVEERARRLTLVEGRPHVLDFVPMEMPNGNCDAVILQAEVLFDDPPAVADSRIEHDLWLVHRDASGREQAFRLVETGRQGEVLDYAFDTITFDGNGARTDGGPLRMNVSGTVKGRIRTDGRIDLVLEASQGFGTESAGRTAAATGKKTLIVSPGEVVEIPFPAAEGTLAGFDLGELFAGHRTALRIVARRVG